ncbi:MAG: hypothetical protein QW670_03690 [Candidatus Bathyarchaeia archaeon]
MKPLLEHSIAFYLQKFAVALGMVFLFALFSLYPRLGYNGEAQVQTLYTNYQLLYRDIEVNCTVTYNPLLFPFSWLISRGRPSYSFLMRIAPKGASEFGVTWPSLEETKEDAVLIVVLNELFINIPFMLAVFLIIELVNVRSIYLCFLGSILGFLIIGSSGAIIGFLLILLIIVLLFRKFKIKGFSDIMDLVWKQK